MHALLRSVVRSVLPLLFFLLHFGDRWTSANQTGESSVPQAEFKISTENRTFQIGERIPIELCFSSTVSKRFEINKANYDRSGRMWYEKFQTEPSEGSRDPLKLYFASGAFIGGGLTSFEFLSSSPTKFNLDVNEWVTFDKPGTYRLTVISDRVNDVQNRAKSGNPRTELTSNSIELKIVAANPVWQHGVYEKSLQVIEQSPPTDSPPRGDGAQARMSAIRDLRFLGTEEAVRKLARLIRGDSGNEDIQCMFGILGSNYQAAGLDEIKKEFAAPDFPISNTLGTAIDRLSIDPAQSPKEIQEKSAQRYQAFRDQLRAVLPLKRGRALSTSLDTLLIYAYETIPSDGRDQIIGELIRTFPELPPKDQATWLGVRWNQVKGAEWLPILRSIALNPQEFPNPRQMPAYESLQAMGVALQDWYEMDPAGAREAILKEIANPKPRFDEKVLGILSDKTLPNAEHAIARNFVATDDYQVEGNLSALLYRYAGPDVLAEVLPKIQQKVGSWACIPQDNSLAYVLKVDAKSASPLIEMAMDARGPGKNACRHMLLGAIGELGPNQNGILESIAIKFLGDADPETAMEVVNYLGLYGTARAEAPLWTLYRAWTQRWQGHEADLQWVNAGQNLHAQDANLGRALVSALAQGAGWIANVETLHKIDVMAFDEQAHLQIANCIRDASSDPLLVTFRPSHARGFPSSFQVAQYGLRSAEALKTKLAQFPRGTRITFVTDPRLTADDTRDLAQLSNYATQIGLVVVPSKDN